jgi:phosphoribosylformylglycinamidine synthase
MRLYRAYFEAARRGLLASGHDLSEGGLAVAVAECCIGGGIGAEVDLGAGGGISDEDFLFSETPGRILAGVRPEREAAFLSVMEGVPRRRMGKVSGSGRLVIKGSGGAEIADIGVGELVELYRGPLYAVLVMSKGER